MGKGQNKERPLESCPAFKGFFYNSVKGNAYPKIILIFSSATLPLQYTKLNSPFICRSLRENVVISSRHRDIGSYAKVIAPFFATRSHITLKLLTEIHRLKFSKEKPLLLS